MERIGKHAQQVDQVIPDGLELKQIGVNVGVMNVNFNQACESKNLSFIVLCFAVSILVFTPITFLVTLFGLNIDTLNSTKLIPGRSGDTDSNTNNYTPPAVLSGKVIAVVIGNS